jgi:hypothetical protein
VVVITAVEAVAIAVVAEAAVAAEAGSDPCPYVHGGGGG